MTENTSKRSKEKILSALKTFPIFTKPVMIKKNGQNHVPQAVFFCIYW